MTLQREEVEALLASAQRGRNAIYIKSDATIAELCRVYLAWLDAPVVDVTDCNHPLRQLPGDPLKVTWDDFHTHRARLVVEE